MSIFDSPNVSLFPGHSVTVGVHWKAIRRRSSFAFSKHWRVFHLLMIIVHIVHQTYKYVCLMYCMYVCMYVCLMYCIYVCEYFYVYFRYTYKYSHVYTQSSTNSKHWRVFHQANILYMSYAVVHILAKIPVLWKLTHIQTYLRKIYNGLQLREDIHVHTIQYTWQTVESVSTDEIDFSAC